MKRSRYKKDMDSKEEACHFIVAIKEQKKLSNIMLFLNPRENLSSPSQNSLLKSLISNLEINNQASDTKLDAPLFTDAVFIYTVTLNFKQRQRIFS